ncbi:MAG: hypothetical protein ACRD40_17540 [Candidatus Acidiferrales bacterium]
MLVYPESFCEALCLPRRLRPVAQPLLAAFASVAQRLFAVRVWISALAFVAADPHFGRALLLLLLLLPLLLPLPFVAAAFWAGDLVFAVDFSFVTPIVLP